MVGLCNPSDRDTLERQAFVRSIHTMGESACSTAVILCVALATLSALATIVYFFDGRDPMYDMENGIHNGFQGYSRKYVPLVEPAKAYDTSLIEHDLMAKSLEKQSLARLANGRPI